MAFSPSFHIRRFSHLASGKRATSFATLGLVGNLLGWSVSSSNRVEHLSVRSSRVAYDTTVSPWFCKRDDIGDNP